jgi:hypothetical protein
MAVDVLTEVVIDRPVREVVEYAGDPSNAPECHRRPPALYGDRHSGTSLSAFSRATDLSRRLSAL